MTYFIIYNQYKEKMEPGPIFLNTTTECTRPKKLLLLANEIAGELLNAYETNATETKINFLIARLQNILDAIRLFRLNDDELIS